MKHLGDITAIDWNKVEPVDCVCGGSPCQDLSVAGKRAGLAGERSGLFMEQIRCVKELRKADELRGRTAEFIRPRYMVWENVPGAFSSGTPKGADFAAVIEEIIKVAEREPLCLCVYRTEDGQNPGVTTLKMAHGVLLGEYTPQSFGEQATSMMRECQLNAEHRNGVSVSRLSQILEVSAHPRYYLSAKACEGILRRAERRGKELPAMLRTALEQMIMREQCQIR